MTRNHLNGIQLLVNGEASGPLAQFARRFHTRLAEQAGQSLEAIHQGRIQLDVCDECDTPGCSSNGYVQILRHQDRLLLAAPTAYEDDTFEVSWAIASNVFNGVGFFVLDKSLVNALAPLLAQLNIPPLTRADLIHAWLLAGPKYRWRAAFSVFMAQASEELLASDAMSNEDVLAAFKRIQAWLHQAPQSPYEGELCMNLPAEATLATLYFDTGPDWPALIASSDLGLAFGTQAAAI